ncbi:MAG TPA: NUDIX domain-containing protein [Herpetosiphonaceae bacterium]
MSIYSHDIYQNIRTRVIVLHEDKILLIRTKQGVQNWRCPGGGLEPGESLAECAAREVLEETGIRAEIGRVAFLREWIVHPPPPGSPGESRHGFGLEVYFYAEPLEPGALGAPLQAEEDDYPPEWLPLAAVPGLSLWPTELKSLARHMLTAPQPAGILSLVADYLPADTPGGTYDWAGPSVPQGGAR